MSEVKVPQAEIDICKEAEKAMTFDGGIADLPKGFDKSVLPEGVTAEVIDAVEAHRAHYLNEVSRAFGKRSIEAMKADETLQETQLSTTFGKDKLGATFRRQYEKPTGIPKDGSPRQTVTDYGQLTVNYKTYGSVGSRGSLKKTREELNNEAREALGK